MKFYSNLSCLLVSLSTMMAKVAENPSSSQEINTVKADTDKSKESPDYLTIFKKTYESRVCELMKELYHKDGDKSSFSFDSASKHFQSLLNLSKEYDEIFKGKNIERIKTLKDLELKILDVENTWYKLYHYFTTTLTTSINRHYEKENEIIKKLCPVLDHMFSYTIKKMHGFNTLIFDQFQSNKYSTNIKDEHAKKEFISKVEDFEVNMAFPKNIEDNVKFLKNKNVFIYDNLEKLKISLRCLYYNIVYLTLNCFEEFFKGKHSGEDNRKFRDNLRYFLLFFDQYVYHHYCINDGTKSSVQKLPIP